MVRQVSACTAPESATTVGILYQTVADL